MTGLRIGGRIERGLRWTGECCRGNRCVRGCRVPTERKCEQRTDRNNQDAKSESSQWRARSWMERKVPPPGLEWPTVTQLPASSLNATKIASCYGSISAGPRSQKSGISSFQRESDHRLQNTPPFVDLAVADTILTTRPSRPAVGSGMRTRTTSPMI